MDLKTQGSVLALFRNLLDSKVTTIPHIKTKPQKPPCKMQPVLQPFIRATPESQGVSSEHIINFLDEIRKDETLDPHCMMILRNGTVIAECSFGAYDRNIWHVSYSMCKSITGLAIGMLIDEGKLGIDDRIIDVLKKHVPKLALLTHKAITVRHLLTMTSGILFNESGAITETDWIRCFMESMILNEPGKHFHYNSMNTYMLSAIVKEISGQNMTDYLMERLFVPMGINEIFWETCPKGIEKGGWGLYIRSEDIAKIGQLVMQKGRWRDKQLISEKWIEDAVSFKVQTPLNFGRYDYGYQIWVGRDRNSFLFNGMFGQNVFGWPDTGFLIVSYAGNDELFQRSSFFTLIDRYFPASLKDDNFSADMISEKALAENPAAYYKLKNLIHSLHDVYKKDDKKPLVPDNVMNANELNALFKRIDGKNYIVDEAAAPSIGLLPLITQTIQNNYTRGLRSIGFEYQGKDLILIITEADEIYKLPIGFDSPEYTDLDSHGEPYKVGIKGIASIDGDGLPVLDLRISFLEIANASFLKITFDNDSIIVKWSESPGESYFINALSDIKNEFKLYLFLEKAFALKAGDFFHTKINSVLEPVIIAKDLDHHLF
ncbi:MAG: serine hydrolase domain-containing protein [Saccharofermentanales bacterium]